MFAAVAVISALLGALALAIGSVGLGHARVERYAAAPVVVAGDQEISWTTDPWGSEPTTVSAGLTERVRIPSGAVDVLREVQGVRAAVADDTFVVREPGTGAGATSGTAGSGTAGSRTASSGTAGSGATSSGMTSSGTATSGTGSGAEAYAGRPWEAAALAPYELLDGREPRQAGEVVAGAGIGDAARVGETLAGRKVVGVAEGPAALYVTAQEARQLAGRPGTVAAVGVIADPGVPVDTLHARVRAALDGAGLKDVAAGQPLRALTGDGRGGVEHLAAPPARTELLRILAAVSGTVLLIAGLVLSSLVAQALHQRGDERELLLAVGATPRQVRAAAGREVTRVAGAAALIGALAAVPLFLAAWSMLRARPGVVPEGLVLPTPPWLFAASLVVAAVVVGLARLVVLFSTRRAGGPGRGVARRVSGLVLIALGAAASAAATTQGGEAAGAAAGAATVTLVSGCALLGPWIARGAMRILDVPFRRLGGAPGRLTAAGAATHSRRLGAALTPVVLVTAFALVQLAAGATMGRAAEEQARDATIADLAIHGTTAEQVRRLPGVTAATDVLRSTVVLARTEAGSPRLDRLPVLGVDAGGLRGTLDPGVVAGGLAGLAGRGTVAVGADMADSLEVRPGSTVVLRLGDGTEQRLRVVAVYARSLALGEFLLPKGELAPHMTDPYPARVLVATEAGATGSEVVPEQVTTAGAELNGLVSATVVAAIGALTVLSVLSTLALIGAGRRGELALLRQVGASAGQVRRTLGLEAGFLTATGLLLGVVVAALPLTAFAWALTGGLPYLPPAQAGLLAGTVVVTVVAGVFLPVAGRRLRS
ncbi:FtsX-like permease family protein [Streptomyces sp. NPDC006482]|uniref:FtsX-like permease family protein n=1 Tax=Streptomyces sp. NPDC006482 TaxID=3154306 RepID=UPI00339DF999